jgi:hypothetical protein
VRGDDRDEDDRDPARLNVRRVGLLVLLVVLLVLPRGGTQQDGRTFQDGARVDVHKSMVEDKNLRPDPADGGGTFVLVAQPDPPAVAGAQGTYVLEYTAGPLGVAKGGALFFQVSPFWFWETPQVRDGSNPGAENTRVETKAPGVALRFKPAGPQCLEIDVDGAPLQAGARVTITYGVPRSAPPFGGARVDAYAESEESFFLWVDGDGNGTRALVRDEPRFRILPGPARDFVVHVPSEVAIGAEFEIALAFLDGSVNAATDFVGEVALAGEGLALPEKVAFAAADRGRKRVRATATSEGVHRVTATARGSVPTAPPFAPRTSNPLVAGATPRRVLWADLHGHSSFSDGTGTPEDYYDYARNVAALDVAVLTDHDHWGIRKLDQSPELWHRIQAATAAANEPGRFTTLLGYEWTSWLYGHRHVLYFGADAADDAKREVISSVDPATDSPQGLWAALRATKARALTFPHHPAGEPVPVDWSIAPDPEFEPVVEITSVHGTSEEPNGPWLISGARKGHFVRDALARGYRLGFVGSGDSHNGHPGLVHLDGPCGGLAAIVASDDTRGALYDALKQRLCWATTGARIVVWFRRGATRMGGEVAAADPPADDAVPYSGFAIGTATLARVEFIKNGAIVAAREGDGSPVASLDWIDPARATGDWVYFRVLQSDGHAAWSSPIFTR